MQDRKNSAMWSCPRCGHRFLRRSRTHSCGIYRIADRFKGKSAVVKVIYRTFKEQLAEHGRVTVYAQKTGIIFHKRHRFALAVPRKGGMDFALCLRKPRKHRTLRRIEHFGGRCYRHWFRIADPKEINTAFRRLVKESAALGN